MQICAPAPSACLRPSHRSSPFRSAQARQKQNVLGGGQVHACPPTSYVTTPPAHRVTCLGKCTLFPPGSKGRKSQGCRWRRSGENQKQSNVGKELCCVISMFHCWLCSLMKARARPGRQRVLYSRNSPQCSRFHEMFHSKRTTEGTTEEKTHTSEASECDAPPLTSQT